MKEILVKSVLNKKKKRDEWFLDDFTLNPYEGCSFNCQYCYIRGSKYGENMEETLAIKINAAEVLDKQLAFRVKKEQYGMIALASATDPYLRIEEKYRLTESFLKLILKHRFPVLIITKSDLVARDIHLLQQIDAAGIHNPEVNHILKGGARISFSFSTLDRRISSTLEPGAPSPAKRLDVMKRCKDAGLTVGVNLIPILPFINDTEDQVEEMVVAFKDAGADYVIGGGLTLFGNGQADSKTLYYNFLQRTFPSIIPDYKKLYGVFFFPPRDYNAAIAATMMKVCQKHNIRDKIV